MTRRQQQLTEPQLAALFDPPVDRRELVRHYTLSARTLWERTREAQASRVMRLPRRLAEDLATRGVAYRGLAGVELQGWLRVREEGRHQVAVDFGSPRAGTLIYTLSCGAALWLEDRQVGQRVGELSLSRGAAPVLSLVLGAELRPGLYRMRLWAACGNLGTPAPVPTTLDVLLKTPSELNLRGITADDLLHRQG